jgi:hypothetical protein
MSTPPKDETTRKSKRFASRLSSLALFAGSCLFALASTEGFFTLLLHHPSWLASLPPALASHVRYYYLLFDRTLIQAQPEASRYDRELFYTLRPGMFRFRNREFDTQFIVNSQGLRDREEALVRPEIVVLGDSFAMGWGVKQHQTYAALLAQRTGRRVLNAGIASYGTARERCLLDRLDLSRARFILVQYEENDFIENEAFASNGNRLVVSRRVIYNNTLANAAAARRYYFGKRTFEILRGAFLPPGTVRQTGPSFAEQAHYCINALAYAGQADLSRMHIVLFEINPYDRMGIGFASALINELARSGYPEWIRGIRVLDFAGLLKRAHYYDLDDHLRPSGHDAVAAELLRVVRLLDQSDSFERAGRR